MDTLLLKEELLKKLPKSSDEIEQQYGKNAIDFIALMKQASGQQRKGGRVGDQYQHVMIHLLAAIVGKDKTERPEPWNKMMKRTGVDRQLLTTATQQRTEVAELAKKQSCCCCPSNSDF